MLYQRFSEIMVSDNITDRSQAVMRDRVRAEELRFITSAILTYRAASPAARARLAP
jgi:hypothetical protein